MECGLPDFSVHGILQARILEWIAIPSLFFFMAEYQIPYDYAVKVTRRFRGLDLMDRGPEELWMEACDFVQEAMIKTIPKKKKCKKAKWLSEKALQIAVKRREVMEKYTMFMDWKNQYSENEYTTQSNL